MNIHGDVNKLTQINSVHGDVSISPSTTKRFMLAQIILFVCILIFSIVVSQLFTLLVFGLLKNQISILETALGYIQQSNSYNLGNYLSVLSSIGLALVVISVAVLSYVKAQQRRELAKGDLKETIKSNVLDKQKLINEGVFRSMAYGEKLKYKSPALTEKNIAECIRLAWLDIIREPVDNELQQRLDILKNVLKVFDKEGPPLFMINYFNRLYAYFFSVLSSCIHILFIQLLIMVLGINVLSLSQIPRWLVDVVIWVFPGILVWQLLLNFRVLNYWRGNYSIDSINKDENYLFFNVMSFRQKLKQMAHFFFDINFYIKMATKENPRLLNLPTVIWTAGWESIFFCSGIISDIVLGWFIITFSHTFNLGLRQVFSIITTAVIFTLIIEIALNWHLFIHLHDYEYLRISLLKAELQLTQRRILRTKGKNDSPSDSDIKKYQALCDHIWSMTGDDVFRKEINNGRTAWI